jgi:hypothetical protein
MLEQKIQLLFRIIFRVCLKLLLTCYTLQRRLGAVRAVTAFFLFAYTPDQENTFRSHVSNPNEREREREIGFYYHGRSSKNSQ